MRNFSSFLTAAAGITCAATLAFAADQTILGKSLLVKDKPGDPTKRTISSSAKEKASPNTLVGNPTLSGSAGGAILTIFVNGASSSSGAFVLAQGTGSNGKPFWTALRNGLGYRYKDPKGQNGTAVKAVLIKRSPSGAFSMKAKLSARSGGPINVVPPKQGNFGGVALKLGIGASAGDRYSVAFGAGSKFINSPTRFKAVKPVAQGVAQ